MPEQNVNLENIPESNRPAVQKFALLLRDVCGDNVLSLTIFGRAASSEFDGSRDVIRNVVVMNSVDLAQLRAISHHGLTLGKSKIAAPLIMTPPYIESSLDTFPVELLCIQQRHAVVYGDDYFTPLSFDATNVRLQCERELKAILIGLRQGLLAAAGRDRMLGALETDAAEGLMRILRAMLWLRGTREALASDAVVEHVEKFVDRRLGGIRASLDKGGPHGWDQFQSLYEDVESLANVVESFS